MIERAKEILKIEGEAVLSLISRLDKGFEDAVNLILNCKGRVIVSGVGKSGIIANKIASTLSSTGTPAFFLHPTEGLHGDIGVLLKDDIFIVISNSGETEEINRLIPSIKRLNIKLISLCGNRNSTLAKNSDVFIDVGIKREACSFGFIPSSSTTSAMAMGDALAICVLEKKGFTQDDFAVLHPAGTLGKRLVLKVSHIMHKGDDIPIVRMDLFMKEAVLEMTRKRLGITTVVDNAGILVGVITDGDLRRLIEKNENIFSIKICDAMTKFPKTIDENTLAIDALKKMEDFFITSLIIPDNENKPIGVVHIHDIIKAGLA
ncbi:TPA: D-arabinose 5-phosphate isomerase [bacterium]|nr:D-arabinose 5-phosphate isomerase [bacterium]